VSVEIRVPDIGDFTDVPVIEILVAPGDTIALEDPLVTLESDKATMDVPSPLAGTVESIAVNVGDKVSQGSLVLVASEDGAAPAPPEPAAPEAPATPAPEADRTTEVLVLGAGPGGYTAAFRAADLGKKVTLVERYERLGGVCLNVGCIPSKALLHVARVLAEGEEAAAQGVRFGEPEIDLDGVRAFKESAVSRLTGGLEGLAKQRKVDVVHGAGRFVGPNVVDVDGTTIGFDQCIIAVGSHAVRLPGFPEDERIVSSTGALELPEIPDRLLVVGGGIIGLEMATVYDALGSKVTVVELLDQVIPGADADVVKPLHKRISQRYEAVHLGVRVAGVEAADDGLRVTFEGDRAPEPATFDRILVAVGRRPNGATIDAEKAGVNVDARGFIAVDSQLRTNVPHIFAIGDVVGEPMLAHKAMHEAKVAAEVIAGEDVAFDVRSIPSVAYTDPEVAWTGLTQAQADERGTEVRTAVFPWAASGRALGIGRPDGMTKLIVDASSDRLLGAGIVGVNAGELIAELAHAIEMGADVEDLALTVHPHPTLSETVGLAAEVAAGTVTDIYVRRRG
jgi:dihydrolipoamide dehydrogenase